MVFLCHCIAVQSIDKQELNQQLIRLSYRKVFFRGKEILFLDSVNVIVNMNGGWLMTANIVLLFTGCWLHSFARKCGFIMFWFYIDIFVFASPWMWNIELRQHTLWEYALSFYIFGMLSTNSSQNSSEMTNFCGVPSLLTDLATDKPATCAVTNLYLYNIIN